MRQSTSIAAVHELSLADADGTGHDARVLVRWATILAMLPVEQQRIRAAVASMSADEFRLWLGAMGRLCLPRAIARARELVEKANALSIVDDDGTLRPVTLPH